VSRLDFAPKIEEIRITDIKQGLGSFTPQPDRAISLTALKTALKKAGYTLASAEVTVKGTLLRDDQDWWLVSDSSQQRFALAGERLAELLGGADLGARVELTGDWQTSGEGSASREVIRPRKAQKLALSPSVGPGWRAAFSKIQLSLADTEHSAAMPLTPIRTTSPGLTVYQGGAVTPRYAFIRQHLGGLKVDRHVLRLNLSYTPTQTLQLEADIPYFSSSFDNGQGSGSGHGWGNATLWGKYRFHRKLETWGDRQAAVRFGLELPTGKKTAPPEAKVAGSEFVRRQLTPIAGGLSAHLDTSYSQARGRIVYGANVEGIVRSERDGFRLGHELRVNTDLEYVLLPRAYRSPENELFIIFETTYVYRGRGRAGGRVAPGSSSQEFLIAPALQYIPSGRFLIEASLQIPAAQRLGPQVLRTDYNLLVGVRYLY
jgi:hypothetical protein